VGDGQVGAVRSPIIQSWRRSRAAGVDPSPAYRPPVVADEEGTSARWEHHRLAGAAGLISDCLGAIAQDSGQLIVVSDADGLLLWIDGPPRVRLDAAESMNFIQGAMWSEAGAGTNAIGTAIAADHAVQVFAAEHFNEVVQEWTCAAAPVHDPDTGRLLGVIDLTGRRKTVRSHNMAVAMAAARSVEFYLRTLMHEGDGRLRSRYGDLLSGRGPRLLVAPSGRVVGSTARGWREGQRLAVPMGGGELVLPDGTPAIAAPLGREEAFLVRAIDGERSAGGQPTQIQLRARLLAAADDARRRVVRDLHDGAQQRLVNTIITLKLARQALGAGQADAVSLISQALEQAEEANAELRELAHGVLPAALTRGGLRAGIESLVARVPTPVSLYVTGERFAPGIEASAYFVVAEALTNVAKHARAGRAEVTARVEHGTLRVRVRDDGVGGARPEGSGLVGLGDRLAALDGRFQVESPPGGGTLVAADIPLPA
jgi:signal transduction histidine kinase